MPFRFNTRNLAIIAMLLALAGGTVNAQPTGPDDDFDSIRLPIPQEEFRGVWVATVANIDWPSKRTLTTDEQKAELIHILDKCVELNLNAVVFQVRPATDALYKSDIEPWSPYLTGKMGQAPEPFYDPLQFVVEEAHKRGLEAHAWFNPYRALGSLKIPVSDDHVSKTKPQIVRTYGDNLWLDPGMKETQEHSLAVILDVVKRYDIDGIHIDDYFYPYKVKDPKTKTEVSFPDDESYAAYKAGGGTLERDDWRRDNINKFVESFYTETKKVKPWVKVGISPFGIWKTGFPPQIKGFSQYNELYSDALLWLKEGWVDYMTPQLYWSVSKPETSFIELLRWWCNESAKSAKRPIWAGMFTSLTQDYDKQTPKSYRPDEIPNQIKWCRLTPGASGQVHFSMKCFFNDPGNLNDALTTGAKDNRGVYASKAVVPPMSWLDKTAPLKPVLKVKRDEGETTRILGMSWEPAEGEDKADMRFWYVQWRSGGHWSNKTIPPTVTSMDFTKDDNVDLVGVRLIDRSSNMGESSDSDEK